MPTLTLISKYNIADGLVLSPSAFINEFLFGIPLKDSNGYNYSISNIEKKIRSATAIVEKLLKIKIGEREITERQDYILEEWLNYGHIKLTNEINELTDDVKGKLNQETVVTFDKQHWTKKGKQLAFIVGSSFGTSTFIGRGNTFPLFRNGQRIIPDFWEVSYKTGLKQIPDDLILFIGYFSSIEILSILGDIQLNLGITNESISFDGLSQSIGTSKSGSTTIYSARIKQYLELMEKIYLSLMKDSYRGIIFEVI